MLIKNSIQIMTKKYIEISAETLRRLKEGKYVEGSLHVDELTNKVVFRAYNRLSRLKQPDRLIAQLEHGWIKESPQRYKFYNSVRKDIGVTKVSVVMGRELSTAMEEVKMDRILDLM